MATACKTLTARQARLVEEFLADFNATAAVRRAGYSARSAHGNSRRYFTPAVVEALEKVWAERSQEAGAFPHLPGAARRRMPDFRRLHIDPALKPLTPRQLRFVDEYMIDLNVAAAAERAGYAAPPACCYAYKVRRLPHVAAAIARRSAVRAAAAEVTGERVLAEMARIGFADYGALVGAVSPLAAGGDAGAGIGALEMTVRLPGEGKAGGQTALKIKWDKQRALDRLARLAGLEGVVGRGKARQAGDGKTGDGLSCPEGHDDLSPWSPLPGPQTMAYESQADVIGFGGAAGGGKTDLALGLALNRHISSAIFRREATQLTAVVERLEGLLGTRRGYNGQTKLWRLSGRQIAFGSAPHLGDERRYQGRPKDLLVLDEAANFLEAQARFLMGWVRTTVPGQKCTTLMTFNPPASAEGRWVIGFFAPWLDAGHPRPAAPGELRWFAVVGGKDVEVADGRAFVMADGEPTHEFDAAVAEAAGTVIRPQSRTFIPSRLADNPHLAQTGYLATLQAMPEPLRSQMLEGDFTAGLEDDAWQVIPTAWVDAAMARFCLRQGSGATGEVRDDLGPMDSLGVDVARGGRDQTVIARRHGRWFDELICLDGPATPDGPSLAGQVIGYRRDAAVAHIDVVGWGASPYDILHGVGIQTVAVNGAARSTAKSREAGIGFVNRRAEIWWRMREALDPAADAPLALPRDAALRADLCAPRWRQAVGGIQIEAKADVMARIGRSPDRGDAVCMALMATPKVGVGRVRRAAPKGSWMG